MPLTMRPPRDAADVQRMIDLVHADPDAHRHVIDLPYRLSSDSLQVAENVRLWEDDGALVAWAAWQQAFITLDHACRRPPDDAALDAMLAWACTRFADVARDRRRTLHYYVDAREDDPAWRARLERHGFTPDPDWQLLHLRRSLDAPPPARELPDGYTIRLLAGSAEIDAYVALHRAAFGTDNMTAEWRTRILGMPRYMPDLDLVACAADGTLAAFCVCWLHRGPLGVEGQIEPFGVHPSHQGKGLGGALLLEGLRRMYTHGARTAHVEVDSMDAGARRLYEHHGGFAPSYTALKYRREY